MSLRNRLRRSFRCCQLGTIGELREYGISWNKLTAIVVKIMTCKYGFDFCSSLTLDDRAVAAMKNKQNIQTSIRFNPVGSSSGCPECTLANTLLAAGALYTCLRWDTINEAIKRLCDGNRALITRRLQIVSGITFATGVPPEIVRSVHRQTSLFI